MNSKTLIQSNTFRVAFLQALLAVIVIFTTAFPGSGWVGVALLVKSYIDMYLRYNTSQPISGIISPSN